VATTEQSNGSILPSVAERERELLAQIEASKTEARDIVDTAHAEARKHHQDEENRILEEVATIRRDRGQNRDTDFRETVNAAERELAGVAEEAMGKVSGVARDVMKLFVPNDSKGNA
jgi:vacuolar-type H+-ATPase subunit H